MLFHPVYSMLKAYYFKHLKMYMEKRFEYFFAQNFILTSTESFSLFVQLNYIINMIFILSFIS